MFRLKRNRLSGSYVVLTATSRRSCAVARPHLGLPVLPEPREVHVLPAVGVGPQRGPGRPRPPIARSSSAGSSQTPSKLAMNGTWRRQKAVASGATQAHRSSEVPDRDEGGGGGARLGGRRHPLDDRVVQAQQVEALPVVAPGAGEKKGWKDGLGHDVGRQAPS